MRVRSLPNIITVLLGLSAFAVPASAQTSDPGGTTASGRATRRPSPLPAAVSTAPTTPRSSPSSSAPSPSCRPTASPPRRSTLRRRSRTRSSPPTRSSACRTCTAAATPASSTRGYDCSGTVSFALNGGGLMRTRSTPAASSAGAGRHRRLDHRLHEPLARVHRHRGPAARHQRRRRPGGLRGPALAPGPALDARLPGPPPARLLGTSGASRRGRPLSPARPGALGADLLAFGERVRAAHLGLALARAPRR